MARVVTARWDGAMATTVTIGDRAWQIGDDLVGRDGLTAPMPTEALLAAVASCFALAMAWVAGKRDMTLPGLTVQVRADYDGPRISAIDIAVRADAPPDVIDDFLPRAQRVCYVTNTLRTPPEMTIRRAD